MSTSPSATFAGFAQRSTAEAVTVAVVTFPAPVCATGAAAGADPGAIVNANPLALAAAGETVEVLVPVDGQVSSNSVAAPGSVIGG